MILTGLIVRVFVCQSQVRCEDWGVKTLVVDAIIMALIFLFFEACDDSFESLEKYN